MPDTCAECEFAVEVDGGGNLECHGLPPDPGGRRIVDSNRPACSLFRLHWEYDTDRDPF